MTSALDAGTPGGQPAARAGITRGRRGRPRDGRVRGRWSFDRISFMVVFLGLPLTVFGVFVISPFVQAVYFSLTDWGGFSPDYNFIGLDNFERMLDDKLFKQAIRNNIIFAAVIPLATISIAFIFASMITIGGPTRGQLRGIRNSTIYRVVSFFPYTIPAIVIGILWSQILDPRSGLLNGLLTGLGFDNFEFFPWLGDMRTARWTIVFVVCWGMIGFYMVLFVAAIKGVPAEIYEAARIDGASRWRMSISITLPMIRDSVQTAYIYIGILALDLFVFAQAMAYSGGPGNTILTMSQMLFRTAFTQGKFGYASAMGVVLAIVTLVFAGLVFFVNWLTGGRGEKVKVVK